MSINQDRGYLKHRNKFAVFVKKLFCLLTADFQESNLGNSMALKTIGRQFPMILETD